MEIASIIISFIGTAATVVSMIIAVIAFRRSKNAEEKANKLEVAINEGLIIFNNHGAVSNRK